MRGRVVAIVGLLSAGCLAYGDRVAPPPPEAVAEQGPRPVPIRDRFAKARLELLRAINADRRAAGLAPVELDSVASLAAQRHAEAMAAGGFFSHFDRAGRAPYHRLASLGGTAHVVENVFRRQERSDDPYLSDDPWDRFDPRDAHLALMASPSHRDAILDPHRTGVGLGFAVDPPRRAVYAVEEFTARHAAITAPAPLAAGRPGRLAGRVLAAELRPLAVVLHREPSARRWPGGDPPEGPYDDGSGDARVVPPWAFSTTADGGFTIDVGGDLPPGLWYGVLYVAPSQEVRLALRRRRADTRQGWPGAAFLLEVRGASEASVR